MNQGLNHVYHIDGNGNKPRVLTSSTNRYGACRGRTAVVAVVLAVALFGMVLGCRKKLTEKPVEGVVGREDSIRDEGDNHVMAEKLSVDDLKAAMVKKNIFRAAHIPMSTTSTNIGPVTDPKVAGPRPLKRPFTVVGFSESAGETRSHLRFQNPDTPYIARAGDVFEETLWIDAIEPPYLICKWADREVRIAAGETSNDALKQLLGLTGKYSLIGTWAVADEWFAEIQLRGEGRWRRVEVGQMLGKALVVEIEPGKVILELNGIEFAIEPTYKQENP